MKLLSRRVVVIVLILTSFGQVRANSQDTIDYVSIEKKLDDYMKYFSEDNPGAVISVMNRGDVIFKRAFGLANIKTKTAMNTEMVFNIANISKSFTALAVMKLVEKKKISLDNNLLDIFDDFPAYGEKVKIKYLLNHSSGLPSYNNEELKTNVEILDYLKKIDKTDYESGTKYRYSNAEYALLVSIIEKVSNMSYQDYMNKYIFKKLKIENAFINDFNLSSTLASGHFKEDGEYYADQQFSKVFGEQGIFMSIENFAKWDKALYTNKLLSCENLSKIFTLNKIDEKRPSYYGYGWALMKRNNTRYYWHGGVGNGYTTMVLHLPDTDVTVLVLTNRNDGYDFLKMAIRVAKLFDKNIKL